jgi:hypothetical protein
MSESIARFKRSDNQSRNLNWNIISPKEWKCSRNSWLLGTRVRTYYSIHLPRQSHQTKSQEFLEHFHSFGDIMFQFKFRLWLSVAERVERRWISLTSWRNLRSSIRTSASTCFFRFNLKTKHVYFIHSCACQYHEDGISHTRGRNPRSSIGTCVRTYYSLWKLITQI